LGGRRGRLISMAETSQAIGLIKEAAQAGARRHKACAVLGISLGTLERWEKADGVEDKRKFRQHIPSNKLTEPERQEVLAISNSEIYCDLPPSKIVPMLADEGYYIASESTFYRILRAENQLLHRQGTRIAKHNKPNEYIAFESNQVWSWDISYLPAQIQGLYFYLYLMMDIYSRKIVGFSVHESESSEQASLLLKQACLDENVMQHQLVLHADNGAPMKGLTMLAMLEKLGVIPSFSRPSVSDDNPYSEALFKTLKYHSTFPLHSKFATIMEARIWCENFVYWYNNQHLHSALKFVTPQQRHSGDDSQIRIKRHQVYEMAKQQHPERWSSNTRNWEVEKTVTLNPNKKSRSTGHENCNLIHNIN
jgi:putative transposase